MSCYRTMNAAAAANLPHLRESYDRAAADLAAFVCAKDAARAAVDSAWAALGDAEDEVAGAWKRLQRAQDSLSQAEADARTGAVVCIEASRVRRSRRAEGGYWYNLPREGICGARGATFASARHLATCPGCVAVREAALASMRELDSETPT